MKHRALFVFLVSLVSCLFLRYIFSQNDKECISDSLTDSKFRSSQIICQRLLNNNQMNVILYIEGDYCASCHADQIISLLSFLKDSIGYGKPIMVCHPNHFDQGMEDMYKEYYGKECKLLFTTEDSIRIMNKWMNPKINFYGIITGPSKEILYAGFLYDKNFISMARVMYGKDLKPKVNLQNKY